MRRPWMSGMLNSVFTPDVVEEECGRCGATAVFLEGVRTLTFSENHRVRIPALRPRRALGYFITAGAWKRRVVGPAVAAAHRASLSPGRGPQRQGRARVNGMGRDRGARRAWRGVHLPGEGADRWRGLAHRSGTASLPASSATRTTWLRPACAGAETTAGGGCYQVSEDAGDQGPAFLGHHGSGTAVAVPLGPLTGCRRTRLAHNAEPRSPQPAVALRRRRRTGQNGMRPRARRPAEPLLPTALELLRNGLLKIRPSTPGALPPARDPAPRVRWVPRSGWRDKRGTKNARTARTTQTATMPTIIMKGSPGWCVLAVCPTGPPVCAVAP